jgi:hypothetical protein
VATRLYYLANALATISPAFDGSWASTTGAVRRRMVGAKDANTETLAGTLAGTAADNKLIAQLLSAPLNGAQTISGTFSMTSRGRELDVADNINRRARAIKVVSKDGSTVRGTLVAWGLQGSTTELSTSMAGQPHGIGGAVTTVNASDNDRILVEYGYSEDTTGTDPQWESVLGGTGTDHATTTNDTTGTVPWFELSSNLTFRNEPFEGTLAGTLPTLTAAMAGKLTMKGPLAGALPTLTADITGTFGTAVSGGFVGTLPALTALLNGTFTLPPLYFTPPHHNRFMPESDPDIPDSMQQPWLTMRPTVPRPINLWVRTDTDGLLHEEQPPSYNVDSRVFMGGRVYGPLSQADIDLITNSGFGAYLTSDPNPQPQP